MTLSSSSHVENLVLIVVKGGGGGLSSYFLCDYFSPASYVEHIEVVNFVLLISLLLFGDILKYFY